MPSIHGSRYGWHALKKKSAGLKKEKLKRYEERKSVFSALGYRNYQEYLASDDWKAVRNQHLALNPTCVCCEAPATQVHYTACDENTLRLDPSSSCIPLRRLPRRHRVRR